MPEIPDIEVFAIGLKQQFGGKKLTQVKVLNSKKIKDSQEALMEHLEGHILEDVYRSGKEFRFAFSNGIILGMHLMLTGDVFPFRDTNEQRFTIAKLHFEDGSGIALTDRMRNAHIKLHPEDTGVDALSEELNFDYLKKALNKKGKVKDILMDQKVIRGIGNGYSDEILWEARISPYSIASAIPEDKIKELVIVIKKVLKEAIDQISKAFPGLVTGEIKEFLKIHRKKVSPTGLAIKVEKSGSRKTYYTEEQVLYK